MTTPRLGPMRQIAWLVNDLDAAMDRWLQQQGVGPFFVLRNCPVENVLYRGTPTGLHMDAALVQVGGVQVELIQQHDDLPSCYRDMYAPGQEGFHHFCYIVDDYQSCVEHFARKQMPIALEGDFGAVRFCYVDTRAGTGCMTELVSAHPDIEAFFGMVADAARDWDGRDPIRVI